MSKVLDHLPAFYRDIKEFQELSSTVTVELEGVEEGLQRMEDDQFILTSSEPAIFRRERDFDIIPDLVTETLDFRKWRLLSLMQDNPPYVLEYLKDLFNNLLGENKHRIDLDISKFELEVLVNVDSSNHYKEVKKMLERIVPLNVDIFSAILMFSEKLMIKTKEYDFDVPYRICNMFRTADIPGGLAKSPIDLADKAYSFDVLYPICNTFTTSEISLENQQINVMLTEEYRNNDILYKRTGTAITGEGEI